GFDECDRSNLYALRDSSDIPSRVLDCELVSLGIRLCCGRTDHLPGRQQQPIEEKLRTASSRVARELCAGNHCCFPVYFDPAHFYPTTRESVSDSVVGMARWALWCSVWFGSNCSRQPLWCRNTHSRCDHGTACVLGHPRSLRLAQL